MAIPSPLASTDDSNRLDKHDYTLLPTKDDETPIGTRRSKVAERRSGLLSSVGVTSIIVFVLCAATYFLATHGTVKRVDPLHAGGGSGTGGDDSPDISHAFDWSPSRVPQCAQITPVAPAHPRENVWSMLTVDEAVEIRNWLFDDARRLNLTRGDHAGMR